MLLKAMNGFLTLSGNSKAVIRRAGKRLVEKNDRLL